MQGQTTGEAARLATLQRYHLLDSGAEPAFDRVARLAADIFDTPYALVSLVDENRQWPKAAVGLDRRETPRATSFCTHVVAAGATLVVPDAREDDRFRDSPLVAGKAGVRFYAGAPLIAPGGQAIGTLCVLDTRPREQLSEARMRQLETLAQIVMGEAELRRTAIERDQVRRTLDRALGFACVAIWQVDPATDAVAWQGAATDLWGADCLTALTTSEAVIARIHPDDRDRVRAELSAAISAGQSFLSEFRIVHPQRGVRWLAARADWDVYYDAAMLAGVNYDISELRDREARGKMLMRELHHRMRNLFATVGAIISLTRHSARDIDDYAERITDRLDAMNRAQNVLLGADFLTGSLHALLAEVEAAFPRIHWSGPDLTLPENSVVAMALLFNELATNAAKYGALARAGGDVSVVWTVEPPIDANSPPVLVLEWREGGGAPVGGAPERTSFGTSLIDRSVRNNLGGHIERQWLAGGLVCTIRIPVRWDRGD